MQRNVPGVIPLPNFANQLIILLAQFNLFEIRYDTLFLYTLWNDAISSINAPRDEDLGGCRAEFGSYFFHFDMIR